MIYMIEVVAISVEDAKDSDDLDFKLFLCHFWGIDFMQNY